MLTAKQVESLARSRTQLNEKVGGRGAGVVNYDGRGGAVRARFRYIGPDGRRVDIPLGVIGGGATVAQVRARAAELAGLRVEHPDLKTWLEDQATLERRAAEAARARGSVQDLITDYLHDLAQRRGEPAAREPRRALQREVLDAHPSLAARPAAEIGPADIATILKPVWERGAATLTNSLRAHLHAAFSYGARAEHDVARAGSTVYHLTTNPVALVPPQPSGKRVRTRALSAEELKILYESIDATRGVGVVVGTFVRFVIAIGGQRPAQVLRVPWSGYDLVGKTIEIHDTKGRGSRDRVHLTPLSDRAVALLNAIRPITGRLCHPWATLRGEGKPIGETALVRAIERFRGDHPEMDHFVARDIRRSVKQLALRAGIPLHDVNLLQHHGMTGVAVQHYANSPEAFLPQLREIMARWEAALGRILAGEPLQEPPAAPPKRARARAKAKA